jgi:hypothetical protein
MYFFMVSHSEVQRNPPKVSNSLRFAEDGTIQSSRPNSFLAVPGKRGWEAFRHHRMIFTGC